MADSSSSDKNGSEGENDNILSTMSPITAQTSVTSPEALIFDTTEDFRKIRRNSNVRFREVKPLSEEEGLASSLPTSINEHAIRSGSHEWRRPTPQPYIELLEERSRLEERVNTLETRLQNLEVPRLSDYSDKGEGSSERTGLNIDPQWLTWQEYLEPINKASNILEVLIEKPHTNTRRRSSVVHTPSEGSAGISEVKNIERIRFRSVHINSALQQITEQTFPTLTCFTIHRPFKILLFYREAIEEYVAEFEENFNRNTSCPLGDQCKARVNHREPWSTSDFYDQPTRESNPIEYKNRHHTSFGQDLQEQNGPSQSSPRLLETQRHAVDHVGSRQIYGSVRSDDSECRHEESEDLLAQSEAIVHLRALLKFMREDMREIFRKHDRLRSSQAGQISFTDVWHLFMAGDLVVNNDESNRMIYRVSILPAHQFFSSRRPVKEMKLRSDGSHAQVESVYSQESTSGLLIDVFHYNFDGKNFGPVESRYVIVVSILHIYTASFRKVDLRLLFLS